jgi:hypothetical protein
MAAFTTVGFMKKSRFAESLIVLILKEGESDVLITEVLRSHGVSAVMFYISAQNMRGRTQTD